MPVCDECGAFVSENFYRVSSDNFGNLYGCLDCGATNAGSKRAFEDKMNTNVDYESE